MATNNCWNNQILDANSQIILNSGTNGVGVSTDAFACAVNIGTGAAVKTSTFGSVNTTSATTVQSGTGALNITSTNGALTVNSGTAVLAISNDANTTTVNLGTGSGAKTVVLGSTNTTSTTTLNAGSGGVKLQANTEGAVITSSTSVMTSVTGTAGFVLTANTAGTAPSFQAIPANSFPWTVTTVDATAVVNNGYIANKAGLLTMTLPVASSVGSIIEITGMNTDLGWKVAQSAGQTIHFGTSDTTTGAAGFISSVKKYDSVRLVCNIANTDWIVLSAQGNITVS